MGDRLRGYYVYAAKKGGFVLQLKLAMKTRLPSPRAEAAPDSPENLALFRQSLEELLPDEHDVPTF